MSKMDLTRYRHSLHAHDFTPGGNSRVVMIRKKEQRTFTSNVNGQEPKIETLTKETVQTFRGNKIERKVTSQKKDSQNVNGDIMNRISLISLNGSETPKKSVMGTSVTSMIENEDRGNIRRKPKVSFSDRSFMDKFAQDCLEAHNELRSNHMSPPLRLSKKLSKYSEEWARSLAARGEMQHRAESCYGENIFQVWSSNPDYVISGNEVVHHWYAEMKDHVFGIEPTTLKTGHFTQVVWTESTDLGVGVAKSRTGQIFVVCNYDPPGNFIGSFKDNVPPIGGFADSPRMVTNDKEFQEEALRFHNQYRSKHGAPPLILSNHLSKYAQEWAERMAKEDKMYHRPGNQFGENIYSQYSSSDATARDAVSSWYQEGKNYTKYSAEPRNPLHTGSGCQTYVRLRRPSEFMGSYTPRPKSSDFDSKPSSNEFSNIDIQKWRSSECLSGNKHKPPSVEYLSNNSLKRRSSGCLSSNTLKPPSDEFLSSDALKWRSSECLSRNALKKPSDEFLSSDALIRRSSGCLSSNTLKVPSIQIMNSNTLKPQSEDFLSNNALKWRSSECLSRNALKTSSDEFSSDNILKRRSSECLTKNTLRLPIEMLNNSALKRRSSEFLSTTLKLPSSEYQSSNALKLPSSEYQSSNALKLPSSEYQSSNALKLPSSEYQSSNALKLPSSEYQSSNALKRQSSIYLNRNTLKPNSSEHSRSNVLKRQPSQYLSNTLQPLIHNDRYWKHRRFRILYHFSLTQ